MRNDNLLYQFDFQVIKGAFNGILRKKSCFFQQVSVDFT